MTARPGDEGHVARLLVNEWIKKVSGGGPVILGFRAQAAQRAIIVVAATGGFALLSGGSDGDAEEARRATATPAAPATVVPETTPTQTGAGLITPIAVSPGDMLSASDLAAREAGEP